MTRSTERPDLKAPETRSLPGNYIRPQTVGEGRPWTAAGWGTNREIDLVRYSGTAVVDTGQAETLGHNIAVLAEVLAAPVAENNLPGIALSPELGTGSAYLRGQES